VCDTTSHRRGSCLAHHSPGDPATQRRGPLLRLVTWWFGPHAIEHAGAIYRPLGVRQAKQLLMATLGRVFRGANYSLEARDRESLRRFERWTIVNESYHLAWCLLLAVVAGWVVVQQRRLPLQLIILGCLVNLYLVFLQRYNRARIRATLYRMETYGRLS